MKKHKNLDEKPVSKYSQKVPYKYTGDIPKPDQIYREAIKSKF